jgi:hypothetical protein
MVGAADAAKERAAAGLDRVLDIEILFGCIADYLNQLGPVSLAS